MTRKLAIPFLCLTIGLISWMYYTKWQSDQISRMAVGADGSPASSPEIVTPAVRHTSVKDAPRSSAPSLLDQLTAVARSGKWDEALKISDHLKVACVSDGDLCERLYRLYVQWTTIDDVPMSARLRLCGFALHALPTPWTVRAIEELAASWVLPLEANRSTRCAAVDDGHLWEHYRKALPDSPDLVAASAVGYTLSMALRRSESGDVNVIQAALMRLYPLDDKPALFPDALMSQIIFEIEFRWSFIKDIDRNNCNLWLQDVAAARTVSRRLRHQIDLMLLQSPKTMAELIKWLEHAASRAFATRLLVLYLSANPDLRFDATLIAKALFSRFTRSEVEAIMSEVISAVPWLVDAVAISRFTKWLSSFARGISADDTYLQCFLIVSTGVRAQSQGIDIYREPGILFDGFDGGGRPAFETWAANAVVVLPMLTEAEASILVSSLSRIAMTLNEPFDDRLRRLESLIDRLPQFLPLAQLRLLQAIWRCGENRLLMHKTDVVRILVRTLNTSFTYSTDKLVKLGQEYYCLELIPIAEKILALCGYPQLDVSIKEALANRASEALSVPAGRPFAEKVVLKLRKALAEALVALSEKGYLPE
jgi:hypothetical protein